VLRSSTRTRTLDRDAKIGGSSISKDTPRSVRNIMEYEISGELSAPPYFTSVYTHPHYPGTDFGSIGALGVHMRLEAVSVVLDYCLAQAGVASGCTVPIYSYSSVSISTSRGFFRCIPCKRDVKFVLVGHVTARCPTRMISSKRANDIDADFEGSQGRKRWLCTSHNRPRLQTSSGQI
jgi:hypothetical protein